MQKRAQRTRGRLLQAALGVFGEKGVEAATIEDITERADLGKGTFYRHFASKEGVVAALIADSVARLIQEIRKAVTGWTGLQDVLAGLLRAHTAFFLQRREEFLLLFQGRLLLKLAREDTTELEKPFSDYLNEIESRIAPFMVPAVAPAKIRRVACALAGFVSGYLSFAMIGLAEPEIEASLGPLRAAFVAACSAFLTESSRPAAVASAAPATKGSSPTATGASASPGGANKAGVTR